MNVPYTYVFRHVHLIALAGQSIGKQSTITMVLSDYLSKKYIVVDTGISVPEETPVGLLVADSQFIVYYQSDDSSHIFRYQLDVLFQHLTTSGLIFSDAHSGPQDSPPIVIPPTEMRRHLFDVESQNNESYYHGIGIYLNNMGLTMRGCDHLPVTMSLKVEGTIGEGQTTLIACHVMDHIFGEHSARDKLRHRQFCRLYHRNVLHSNRIHVHGVPLIFLAGAGFVTYVKKGDKTTKSPPALMLIVFPVRAIDEPPFEIKFQLPSSLDPSKIRGAEIDDSCGRLFVITADANAFIFDLV